MNSTEDERRLVARFVAHREERAFEILYDRHTPSLYRLALRLSAGNTAVAEDLVHDAWMRAVPRLRQFAWASSLRTWLSGFVVNLWREHWREQRDLLLLDDAVATDDDALRGTFDRIDLERALAALAPGYRVVLVLHDLEGYTHEDIASLLGVDPGTSKSQLSRARAAMRRALAPTPLQR